MNCLTSLPSTRYYHSFSSLLETSALQQTQYLIDTAVFTRNGQTIQAQSPISDFVRALEGLPAQHDQLLQWSIQGLTDRAGQSFLRVQLKGSVVLNCQRCLKDFDYAIQADTTVLVVEDEAELDIDIDDPDTPERILASRQLNALELIEDELILSLPYVPRHTECPDLPEALQHQSEEAEDEKPNPFAVLSQLKKS